MEPVEVELHEQTSASNVLNAGQSGTDHAIHEAKPSLDEKQNVEEQEEEVEEEPIKEKHSASDAAGEAVKKAVEEFFHRPKHSVAFSLLAMFLQVVTLVFFFIFVTFEEAYEESTQVAKDNNVVYYYKSVTDITFMLFIGFGYLMTNLKRASYSSIGMSFLVSCFVIEWTVLFLGFWEYIYFGYTTATIQFNLKYVIQGLFAAATVLVSFGAVIGKITPAQFIIMAFIETFFYCLNVYLSLVFKGLDVGGSMLIPTFGCYFGLFCSWIFTRENAKGSHAAKGTTYTHDMFSMIGTIFLFVFWPSFNSAIAFPEAQARTILATIMALVGSCIFAFLFSSIVNGKFEMEHIQNAALTGGVIIGTAADMIWSPAGAMLVGMLGGAVTVFGIKFVTPNLERWLRLHDSCGINNLHGMPGILGGIIGIVTSAAYYPIHPSHFPQGIYQPLYQFATLVVSLGIAIVSGAFTGLILRWFVPETSHYYDDKWAWHTGDYFAVEDGHAHVEKEETKKSAGSKSKKMEDSKMKQVEEDSVISNSNSRLELMSGEQTGNPVSSLARETSITHIVV